jgi:hypothetical protein
MGILCEAAGKKWRKNIMRKRPIRELRRRIFSRVFVDAAPPEEGNVLVFGSGRSGTTWIADLINHDMSFRFMFEPFHNRFLRNLGLPSGMDHVERDTQDPRLEDIVRRIMWGRIRDPWVDGHNRTGWCRRRLIKDVSICKGIGWLVDRFPQYRYICVVRNPIALIHSQRAMGWKTINCIERYAGRISRLGISAEALTALVRDEPSMMMVQWCLDLRMVLEAMQRHPVALFSYEALTEDREAQLSRLAALIPGVSVEAMRRGADRPSLTTRKESAVITGNAEGEYERWRDAYTGTAHDMMSLFGLPRLYDASMRPEKALQEGRPSLGV